MAKNSRPQLKHGTATPYLAIFDHLGKPIIDPDSGLPIGMYTTDFFYEYLEQGSDTSDISLQTDNENLIDIHQLGNDRTLVLQWGWIFPDGTSSSSPVRRVVIRDHSVDFVDSGVKITLKCTDGFDKVKSLPADRKPQLFADWLVANMSGYGINVVSNKVGTAVTFEKQNNGNTKNIQTSK